MFNKLRNKFILINLLTTTAVLVIAFGAIYLTAANSAERRGPAPTEMRPEFNQEFNKYLDERIAEERKTSLNELLISLIVTGAVVEVMVFLISLYLANQAIKPVKTAYLAQKEFIANASHEIKTPLAVIQANLEAADIKGNKWINNVAIKAEELTSLNNQLLTLARLEAHTNVKTIEKINLKSFLDSQITPLEPEIKKQKITVKINNQTTKDLSLNTAGFKQILNILLDNAIKYCDKKITITISDGEVKIKNDGATISKEKLPHIFDRFYQTDKTKSGVGLGLAIAKKLAEENHWDLFADSTISSTTFTLKLKK